MLIKRLQKYGNSHALVIDKALMDATGISPDTDLKITTQAGAITIAAANVGLGTDRVAATLAKLRPQYDEMLKNLAK